MHLQDDCFGRLAQTQVYVPGTGMLDRVMHRLLRDTIEFLFDLEREVRLLAQLCLHGNTMTCLQRCPLLGKCADQSLAFQRFGTQFKDQSAHLVQGGLGQ